MAAADGPVSISSRPRMIQEALLSPGCTLAVTTATGQAALPMRILHVHTSEYGKKKKGDKKKPAGLCMCTHQSRVKRRKEARRNPQVKL